MTHNPSPLFRAATFRILSRLACMGALGFVLQFTVATVGWAEDDEDERPRIEYGLVLRHFDTEDDKLLLERIADVVSFRLDSSDPRLHAKRMRSEYRGRLFAAGEGTYQLSVFGSGKFRIRLRGEVVLSGESNTLAWLESEPLPLPFGRHPMEIEFVGGAGDSIALYWSGPKFQREPVGSQFLLRSPNDEIDNASERGATLVRALRCGACHDLPGGVIAAPDLKQLGGAMHAAWLDDWLAAPAEGAKPLDPAVRRMPHFPLSADEVAALRAALLTEPAGAPSASRKPSSQKDLQLGETVVHQVGCLACHSIDGAGGQAGVFGGGDLTQIASKRPASFFSRWLEDPKELNANHRMPIFDLEKKERAVIASYLATLGDAPKPPATTGSPELREKGKQLLKRRGCVQCHQVDGVQVDAQPRSVRLSEGSNWNDSCLQEPSALRPGYRLAKGDANAVKTFIQQLPQTPNRAKGGKVAGGAQLLQENNCTACHQRNGEPGLGPTLLRLADQQPKWAASLPTLKPPSLNSVGDKLHRQALRDAIGRKGKPRREWLAVRMPKFQLNDEELDSIIATMAQQDRIPPGADEDRQPSPAPPSPLERTIAGRRLVTADGFGCTSCHAVGKVKPSKAPVNAKGPDLLMLGKRIRKDWYDRWVRNPARIVPRMEMPSVQTPVRGVLHGSLDDQLAAVWTVLNTEGFVPPEPNPIRIVRHHNLRDQTVPSASPASPINDERGHVVTDVLHLTDEDTLIKPLLIGLSNRQNLLYDLQSGRLRGWWTGDTARQHTKGKTWFWRPGAINLLADSNPTSEFSLFVDEKSIAPVRRGQHVTEMDWLEYKSRDVHWGYQLHFDAQTERVVEVREAWSPDGEDLVRTIELNGKPDMVLRLDLPFVLQQGEQAKPGVFVLTRDTPLGVAKVTIACSTASRWQRGDGSAGLQVRLEDGGAAIEMTFASPTAPDEFHPLPKPIKPLAPTPMAVAPGFEATRLPFAMQMMPTALAWRRGGPADGALVITSLKGRVWQATDTDGDQLEDRAQVFADDLAAPFGVAIPSTAEANAIDVVGKYALLRLTDRNNDGRADRWDRLASGWGHTADYHDWAIGLPQDADGNYYIATACQQDNRSRAAAKWRGEVLRLSPKSSKPLSGGREAPLYEIQPLSAGHRFPIGIARNRQGDLFVTDNQGNYNPFNELNHVQAGKRFGFINKLDRRPDFKPPLTEPAINIPHPWTRSVNGICFLESPDVNSPRFGLYEGQLVGCEYDTRRLIRMSVESVGGVFQGAAYPLTREHDGAEPLLGPLCAAVSPAGDLYIGCIRDSGWGGSNNVGTVVRLRPKPEGLPAGIGEVRVSPEGFIVRLQSAHKIDPTLADQASRIRISSYTRVSTPAYGGNDVDRRDEKVVGSTYDMASGELTIRLRDFQQSKVAGRVFDIRIESLAKPGEEFFPAEAYYTVHRVPAAKP